MVFDVVVFHVFELFSVIFYAVSFFIQKRACGVLKSIFQQHKRFGYEGYVEVMSSFDFMPEHKTKTDLSICVC